MSNANRRKIEELLDESSILEGMERLALLEEAARLADMSNDTDAGMAIRDEIVDAATWAGVYERAMASFNWILAQFDRNPRYADNEHEVLWRYKCTCTSSRR